MSISKVARLLPREPLLLGKSLVCYLVLLVFLDFSSVSMVMGIFSSHISLCPIYSDSHQEAVLPDAMDPGEQVNYMSISGEASEEASGNS